MHELDLAAHRATMPAMKPRNAWRAWPAILLLAALPAGAQQIKRWVDERGMVHYSDTAPASAPVTAIPSVPPLSDADKAQADERMRQYREILAQPPAPAASAAPAPRAAPAPQDDSCAGQWARYNAAYACMNPYRLAGGGVRPEGFDKCPVVPQPSCPAP